jgi:excisionase family DNA binding protein
MRSSVLCMTQVDPLLTASQVAQRLAEGGIPVSDETVRQWAKSGRLPYVEVPSGRRWFRREDVEAILRGDTPASAA